MTSSDDLYAWCDYPFVEILGSSSGILSGYTLAVKDIYPVAGYVNGWGSPTRLSEAVPDTDTQESIRKLLDSGARFVGKSQCDELCYSLNGVNAHYGMPLNGAAPDRITGGSSSGSASLVSNGVVDIATGSDTGGSIRAPASYCGLLGLRITHGRVSLEGAMPLAPTFDCFGWFARDAEIYNKVGDVLLGDDYGSGISGSLIGMTELDSQLLGEEERSAFAESVSLVERRLGESRRMVSLPFALDSAYWSFRKCQAREAHESLGDWIASRRPNLGPGVKDRFAYGASLTTSEVESAKSERETITEQVESLIEDNLLVFPTSPSCAPLRSANHDALQEFRERALVLLCLSGLSGLPQITLPLCEVHGAPMGLSLMGSRGSDRQLITLAQKILSSG